MTAQPGTAGTANGPEGFEQTTLSAAALHHAEKVRGISRRTLERLGVRSGTAYFPQLGATSDAIFFPTIVAGDLVNYKAVAFPEKAFIGQKGGTLQFFNLGQVLEGIDAGRVDTVYITEGEWDAAALIEAGLAPETVLSVPNGAREQKADEDAGDGEAEALPKGYGFVVDALKMGLGNVKRFVFCGDMDKPGLALREAMARILGIARFWFVDWPEGAKDANDFLRSDGGEAVRDLVTEGAQAWPVIGLYRLHELPDVPPLDVWHTGFAGWDGRIHLAPGTLSVVTGHPGHGKTHMFAQVWFQIAKRYGLIIATATFETRAKPHYRRHLRSLWAGGVLEKDMDHKEKALADQWINDHYLFLLHPEQKPTLTWVLDMAEIAVVRHGARVIQIDPWNRLESQRAERESQTEYTGRCLTALYVFAQQFNVHVQVLAHPAKMDGARRGQAPTLEDISDSKHWDNRVDQGFVVHRPKAFEGGQRVTNCFVSHVKARFDELGHQCRMEMNLNLQRGIFEEVLE